MSDIPFDPQSEPHAAVLLLQVLAYREQARDAAQPVRFGAAGGTLGRAPENDLVLDDPGKYISRVHARVSWRDGRFYLRDEGVNPSVVNGRPLGSGAETALADGAHIVLGDYTVLARLEAASDATLLVAPHAAPVPVPPLPPFEPPPPAAAQELPRFEPPAAPARSAPPEPGHVDALAGARILDTHDSLAAGPDPLGLNLFAGMAPATAHDAGARRAAPPYRGAESDHAAPELHVFAMPAIPAGYDPLADLLPPVAAAPAPPVSVAPAPPAPAPQPVPARQPSAPSAPAAVDDAVLAALLDGLGLPHLRPAGSPEALAREVGRMLRASVAGTIDVLMARALTKRESRIEMTMIAARANNPLKFFPDAASALTQMLGPVQPGYLPPLAALDSAFDDLKAHELAVIAGMRAALAAVAQRFDPARIESRLADPARLDRLFPAARKARLWDLLAEHHAAMARDADEDLQRLFGEKFAAAYDEQVDRLRRERG